MTRDRARNWRQRHLRVDTLTWRVLQVSLNNKFWCQDRKRNLFRRKWKMFGWKSFWPPPHHRRFHSNLNLSLNRRCHLNLNSNLNLNLNRRCSTTLWARWSLSGGCRRSWPESKNNWKWLLITNFFEMVSSNWSG